MKLPIYPDERPKTRGECYEMPRPCPFVSCRYHLAHGRLQPKSESGRALAMSYEQALALLKKYPSMKAATRETGVQPSTFKNALAAGPVDVEASADFVAGMKISCALDLADEGQTSAQDIADIEHVTKSWVDKLILTLRQRLNLELSQTELMHLITAYDAQEFDQWAHPE